MSMGICGYIESEGVKYWKPNMAALDGDLGSQIVHDIKSTPAPDFDKLKAQAEDINERMRKAKKDGSF